MGWSHCPFMTESVCEVGRYVNRKAEIIVHLADISSGKPGFATQPPGMFE
jgi:hypothetical protein